MIDEEGGTSVVIQTDVTQEDSCRRGVAKTVQHFGTVHILVNIGKFASSSAREESNSLANDNLSSWCWWGNG
jgi:NAD(P)-dependent dehydrogenase (short-subunit alcohol dehydrogenase family)